MDYGKLGPSESIRSSFSDPTQAQPTTLRHHRRRRRFLLLGLTATLFLAASAASVALLLRSKTNRRAGLNRSPTQAISQTCKLTQYPELCISSLVNFPGALDAGERDLVHISLNMTLQRVGSARYAASSIAGVSMNQIARSAYDDCVELLDDSVHQLSQSLLVVAGGDGAPSDEDALTWLSAALTNQDTCAEGLDMVDDRYVQGQMTNFLKDLAELVSNSLAIFAAASRNQDFSGIPIENRKRRRLLASGFPDWVNPIDRKLLQTPGDSIQADFIVSKDGSGTHKTIGDAVKAAPEGSSRRIIIYVKAGRYEENIKVARKKINLMFVGEGMGKTVVAGSRSVYDKFTTFHTATFASTGTGFIIKEMTIENSAGPEKHQAVALRVGADRAVVYHCSIIGYQDSLYVHSQRQFFRECDIYGTIDFIFGNAAVVLQKCNIWARKPMAKQKNTITAQNRKDPNQNTGISIHNCKIMAASDLSAVRGSVQTFLGRPWKMYSRVVYMQSFMGDLIDPAGWLEWNGNFALSTLYYGEYMNEGPGAGVAKRVKWPGFRVITEEEEAGKFTVGKFIYGSSWLPATGVSFIAGLSE
ncbi:probable pectinesterase/pectinesterase inhibitor 34 [Phalaenopsis equestris]|uniref:probable pectinesterase/pectinesterase inhibitor 34 n=1 Tax=Phalaenopsis equestris TaxID=78828 RepID=UPI0009E3DF0D|nr:probable pectinesterase/pectinesterase inhibitor 34 [Phalaenopsis equestris]